jgi:hypothetical protein
MSVNLTNRNDFIIYMFLLVVARWKERKLRSKDLLPKTMLKNVVSLHGWWLHKVAKCKSFIT